LDAFMARQLKRLQMRYGEDLRAALERAKASTGAPFAETIRRAVLGMPSPPPLAPALSTWDQDAVKALGKIGVLLNQIARRVHQVPGATISKDEFYGVDQALVAVVRYTLGLSDKMEVFHRLRFSTLRPEDLTSPPAHAPAPTPPP
jgi:hypothetical protein